MRSRSVSVAIAGIAILAGSVAAAATVLEKFHFKGKSAFAVCRMSTPITCDGDFPGQVDVGVFISGDEAASRDNQSPREASNMIFATIIQTNSCTGESSADVGSANGGLEIHALNSAEIQGTIPLRDAYTEEPDGTLDVDLDVNGFGDTQTQGDHIRFDFPTDDGQLFIDIRFTEKSRSATASGTIRLDGTDIPCTIDEAGMIDTKNGSRQTLR
jgi:hypothetical protein